MEIHVIPMYLPESCMEPLGLCMVCLQEFTAFELDNARARYAFTLQGYSLI